MSKTPHNTKKILIVEDEIFLLDILEKRLEQKGFTVLKADDGEKGLEFALREHPDLILLDILMPKMDGLEMTKKLREDAWGKNAHVVVLSNLNETGTRREFEELGIDEYYVKSDWKLEDIGKKAEQWLA
ncbi:response regulator [Patescibacteria group bacterium]|nr:response regulator [Patescibacteria group bacterium]